ncbi:MAG: hypothetical protein Q8R83_02705 [Legionellaceae bacterium]|nr:hypothetical protein [Legionellaceae bacterium]
MKKNYNIYAILLLAVCSCLVFQDFILSNMIFIGDSDRLNTFLNIRKFQIDSLQEYGHVPVWNENMFMGYSLSGLHWMLPNFDVFAWIQSLFSIKSIYIVTTYTTCILNFFTACSAYLFINYIIKDKFSSVIGSVLYACSAISLIRVSQLDNASFVLLLTPLALYSIRKFFYESHYKYLLYLILVCVCMLTMSFLQEVSYGFILMGAYSLYLAIITKKWKIFSLLVVAFITSIIISFPRIYTVLQELGTLERTKTFHLTDPKELLRWVFEGIFGRYPSELPQNYKYNIHEGLQIYTSVLAFFSVLLLTCIYIIKSKFGKITFFVFLLSLIYIFTSFDVSTFLYCCILFSITVIILFWLVSNSRTPNGVWFNIKDDNSDLLFFAGFLIVCLLVILMPFARKIVYNLFFKMDFTHSRFSIVAVLPYALLTSYFIKSIFGESNLKKWNWRHIFTVVLAVIFSFIILKSCNLIWDYHKFDVALQPVLQIILSKAVIYILMLFIVFMLLMTLVIQTRQRSIYRFFFCIMIGSLMAGDAIFYARMQLFGQQTKSMIPFASNDLYTTSSSSFNVPNREDIRLLRKKLETDNFRVAFVGSNQEFPAYYSSHLSQYWHLRLIEGYGAGVPKRLAILPWNDGVNRLRAIKFESWNQVQWDLLAMLNVKYIINLNYNLYFNKFISTAPYQELEIHENPYETIPRVFFAKKIAPYHLTLNVKRETLSPIPHLSIVDGRKVLVSWFKNNNYNYEDFLYYIESKDAIDGAYGFVSAVKTNFYLSENLVPGKTYYFRIRAQNREESTLGKFAAYGEEQRVKIPLNSTKTSLPLPENIKVDVIDKYSMLITWHKALPYISYNIEVITDDDKQLFKSESGAHSQLITLNKSIVGQIKVKSCYQNECSQNATHANFDLSNAKGHIYPKTSLKIALGDNIYANPIALSKVEGIKKTLEFLTAGKIHANFNNDYIKIKITPSNEDRFLVLNEMFHHTWKAYANGKEAKVYPVNVVMRGLIVPKHTTLVELRSVPFISSLFGIFIMIAGIVICIGLLLYSRNLNKRMLK